MIEGGCLCGAVRYKISAEPIVMRACWCRLCQFIAAGNDAIAITGELRDYVSTADSGNHMHRRFCPACGTHMFSAAEERAHLIIVRAGTLDDPGIVAMDAVIWTAQAPSWAHIDANIAQFEGQPPPAA